MKCMIAFACLLAVASAGYVNNAVVYGAYDDGSYKGEFYKGDVVPYYSGAVGYSTYGTPAVAYKAPLVSAPHPVYTPKTYVTPYVHGYAHGYTHAVAPITHTYGYTAPLATEARLVDPVAIAAGAPLPTGDTVEVAAAKAKHFEAHAAAKGIAYSAIKPVVAYTGYAHSVAPITHTYGYAHATPLATEARLVDPVAIAAGAPLPGGDTVEVAAAKAFHHQAHVEAKTGHLLAKTGHIIAKRSPALLATGYAAPLTYTPTTYGYSSYATPLAYSGYTGYGYGGYLGAYYG